MLGVERRNSMPAKTRSRFDYRSNSHDILTTLEPTKEEEPRRNSLTHKFKLDPELMEQMQRKRSELLEEKTKRLNSMRYRNLKEVSFDYFSAEWIESIQIIGFEHRSFGFKKYTMFNIKVTRSVGKEKSSFIFRKFQEFEQLHSVLQEKFNQLPIFPDKQSKPAKTISPSAVKQTKNHTLKTRLNSYFEELLCSANREEILHMPEFDLFCRPTCNDLNDELFYLKMEKKGVDLLTSK